MCDKEDTTCQTAEVPHKDVTTHLVLVSKVPGVEFIVLEALVEACQAVLPAGPVEAQ